jgi:RimJ/RimL family protein N-acetyltransferase
MVKWLCTQRLSLRPADAESMRADIAGRHELVVNLGAEVPEDLPPEMLRDVLGVFQQWLEENPANAPWLIWYILLQDEEDNQPVLVGSIGFKGSPDDKGRVEIGYSILHRWQNQGIATEAIQILSDWAFTQKGVTQVIAQVEPANLPSIRVLEKSGYQSIGKGTEPGHQLYSISLR